MWHRHGKITSANKEIVVKVVAFLAALVLFILVNHKPCISKFWNKCQDWSGPLWTLKSHIPCSIRIFTWFDYWEQTSLCCTHSCRRCRVLITPSFSWHALLYTLKFLDYLWTIPNNYQPTQKVRKLSFHIRNSSLFGKQECL